MMEKDIRKVYLEIESLVKEAKDKVEKAMELADEHGLEFSIQLGDYGYNSLSGKYKGRYIDDRWETSDPWCGNNRGEWERL